MTEIGFSLLPDRPGPTLKGWVIERLTDLRDRMRRDIAASDDQLTAAMAEAERKIREAHDVLASRSDP